MVLPQEELDDDGGFSRSSRGRMPSGKPNPVDVHVGSRVRLRRTLLGMSQEKLGEALGSYVPAGAKIRARGQSHWC